MRHVRVQAADPGTQPPQGHEDQPGFEIELIRDLHAAGGYSDKGIVNHLAFTVNSIAEAMEYYRNKGIEFNSAEPNTGIDGAKTVFFHGPDRELLQFVQPVRQATAR